MMKHILCSALLIGFSIVAMTACSSVDGPSDFAERSMDQEYVILSDSWEFLRKDSIDHAIRVAAHLNPDIGITGGPSEEGKAHLTLDGGQSWIISDSSVECLFSLDMVDALVAWQCSLGPVARSVDGGLTWESVTDFGNYCKFLSFLDARTGWIASTDHLGITIDGGGSWQSVSLPDDMSKILAISLQTSLQGAVLDTTGRLFVTADGGETWQERNLPIGDARISEVETASAGLRFLDDQHGFVVLHISGNSQSKVVEFQTADGGMNWVSTDVADTPMFVSLYLSHDASYLTITNMMKPEIVLLKRKDGFK
jgi:photosystem II stability/assembly factor-like uncharacterized protein